MTLKPTTTSAVTHRFQQKTNKQKSTKQEEEEQQRNQQQQKTKQTKTATTQSLSQPVRLYQGDFTEPTHRQQ